MIQFLCQCAFRQQWYVQHNVLLIASAAGLLLCRKKDEEEIDPEQLRKDMERLEMIKQKRCPAAPDLGSLMCTDAQESGSLEQELFYIRFQDREAAVGVLLLIVFACLCGGREADRLDRIKKEGFDRFAPLSDTNPR